MGLLDLIRPLREHAQRRRIVLLLVAATLLAELLDVIGEGRSGVSGVASISGAEALASLAGLATAGLLGRRIARPGPTRAGRVRTAVLLIVALLGALLVHESTAMLLDAGHGETAGQLVAHVAAGVLPVAFALGVVVALLAGVHVVRRVAARRRGRGPLVVVVRATPRRRPAARREAVVPGPLRALGIAG
ncbi:hypothetical protein, partial [Patulibacter sp.]|uniref:hypothetical protein n=1 Tax=Patulibacter sp. TaxID=1912859 RepID=UPI002717EFCA